MPLGFSSLPVTLGQEASRAGLDQAAREYLGWYGDPLAVLAGSREADPDFILGEILTGVLQLLSGEPGRSAGVAGCLAEAKAKEARLSSWERAHLAAFDAWSRDEIRLATRIWEQILIDHPGDIWALRFAHDTYFYLGEAAVMRDSLARVLPAWPADHELHGYLLGMHAFGLEESGDYRAAESAGRRAVERNPADTWAVHAVAHVLEMEGRQLEGIAWLSGLEPHWMAAPALAVHQWWHLALFLMERGRFEEVLAIYDRHIRGTPSGALLDLVDAAALLWRLQLAGIDVGERWQGLREHWYGHLEDHVLAFNDAHIAMVAGGLKDRATLERQANSLAGYVAAGQGTNHGIARDLGRAVVEAIAAFAAGDFGRAADLLLPVRYDIWRMGGSHAQRDLFTQTLIAASIAAERWPLARALLAERVALRPASRRSWEQYAEVLRRLGDEPGAGEALRRAAPD
ncbi:MAG TPA: tetratricopeptide repeat protein [Verrucomicrobiae bacterium]|nr:tetratricopeptide repeat protein [Verrucomicrobiae bacterium]